MFVKPFKLLITFLFLPLLSFSQPTKYTNGLRHFQGYAMYGVYAGLSNKTNIFGISYQNYLSRNIGIKINGGYEKRYFDLSDYNAFNINPEFLYTISTDKKLYYLNLKAGLLAGEEFTSNEILNKKKKNFYYGESLGVCLELFLASNFKIDLDFEQRFLQKSLIADYRYYFKLSTYINF